MYKFEKYLQNHRILILDGSKRLRRYPNITVDKIYRPLQHKWERDLRKLYEHTSFLDRSRWYGDWSKQPSGYDMVIFINGIRGRDMVEFFQRHNPGARTIIYYETTIDKTDRKAPHFYKELNVEFVSFDKDDCERWREYGMTYNHFYYDYYDGSLADLRGKQAHYTVDNDIYFCAYDKNRLDKIIELGQKFDSLGLRSRLNVVRTPHKRYAKRYEPYLTARRLPYQEIAAGIYQSRAILDIVEAGQRGITLRPMEAIFFRKKLITNNPHVKDYDFYRPENVFVLGERPMDQLPHWLIQPYVEIPQAIVEQYTVEAWLDRFFA